MGQAATIGGQTGGISRRGSNQSGMRAYNERLVLSLIRQDGAMAKADIARRTGLSAQTVSVIIRALEAEGLLTRGEPVRGRIGQPSVPMRLASDGAFFLGLKIGRRSLELVLTDFLGTVRHRVRRSHAFPTPERTIKFVTDAMAEIKGALKHDDHARISGMGIALPFQLWEWPQTPGTEDAGMAGWQDLDIAVEIGTRIGMPVVVCNDASAACGAELVFGTSDVPRDFLYLFVGFFIGGGLVLDSTLYTGRRGNAAAIGSMMVQTGDGVPRQLVDIASLATLETALTANGQGEAMFWDDPADWHIPDAQRDAWLDTAAEGIAQAVLLSVCLIDLDHVLIDGWLPADLRADLVARVGARIARTPLAGVQPPCILEGSIGPDARALGAASLPLSERFLVDANSFQKGRSK